MHLTCPACGAQYEVADADIPAAGRAVRCSACRAEWMATPAAAAARPVVEAPRPAPAPIAPPIAPAAGSRPDPAPASAPRRGAAEAPAGVSAATLIGSLEADGGARRGGGFAAGLALVVVIAAGALGLYARPDAVVTALPVVAAPVAAYVAWVDDARAALDRVVADLSSR